MEMDLAGLVKHAKVHGSGVQIDAAVKFVLLGVESHRFPLVNGLSGQPPAYSFWSRQRRGLNEYQRVAADEAGASDGASQLNAVLGRFSPGDEAPHDEYFRDLVS
jgi:hypothetical protein